MICIHRSSERINSVVVCLFVCFLEDTEATSLKNLLLKSIPSPKRIFVFWGLIGFYNKVVRKHFPKDF